MFRTKKDVERHVNDVLSKIDNENEKNLRGYTFARLYFQVKDYESAKKYLSGFLSVRHHHAASHKLMGQIYEATNNHENALQSYKRSLEIDSHQNDIVLKICELYCQVPVDHETARYWADRAEQLFPHHETVFKLREYLVSAEGEPDRQELENLIASELAAQPKNVDLRIKLLRLYLDTERVKEAYDHATMIESKRLFVHSVDWYYLLGDIFEAYQEEFNQNLEAQFYINYLTALDHLIYLTLAEPHTFVLENGKTSSSSNDAAAVLMTFDQLLKKAVEKDIKEGSWNYFIFHMKGQLYFHMTCLLMKRAKMDQGNRKEAFRFISGLAVVCYTFKPVNLLQEVWFSQMEDNQKTFTSFFQQGTLRTCFIGNVLLSLCKEDKRNWLQKIKSEVCILQVKERIYSRIFTSLFQKNKLTSSYFITDTTFEQCSLELPTETALKEYDKSASIFCPDSLHHLVWLQLHIEKHNGLSHDNIAEIFKNLQYSNEYLSKGSCESLCILDLEAFLHATVNDSKIILERRNNILPARSDSVLSFPPDITDALCTKAQACWWKAAHGLYTCAIKEKLGEHRHNLQRGLEVIRGVGSHGMEVQLVLHLARIFSDKANTLDKSIENKTDKKKNKFYSDRVVALYDRAVHYWNIALGMLEKLASGQTPKIPKDSLFVGCNKALSKDEIKQFQEEGQLFLAVRCMDRDELDKAAEILSKLSSPYASYYLALTLKKLASHEPKYSSVRAALLNKSKNSLLETMDRIKDDKSHPLNKELFIELEDVENDLAIEHTVTGENNCEDEDEIDAYDGSSIHNSSHSWLNNKSALHSTPTPSAKFVSSKRSVKLASQDSLPRHFEPSPERLDAQIRALALNQDTLMKSFLQQQQSLLETNKSILEALEQNKKVVQELKKLLEALSISDQKPQRKTVPKKPGYLKGQGDEEEDYYDPNNMLEYYEDGGDEYRSSGYNFDRSSRIAHDPAHGASAPLNYVVSPALPPGPPPPLNHYNYQYPPHAVLPTPPPAVERPPYYHPPPSQGLPFSEGQQLPQFHFHVASSVVKPPPPPTCLPPVVSALPPPVNMPPSSVVMPPAAPPPLPVPPPWSKPVTVPHAFQIPLPMSVFVSAPSSIVQQTSAAVTQSSATPVTTSHSQLKDLLQTPVSKTITFGQPLTTTTSVLNTSPSIFSGFGKTPETPKERSRYDSECATSPDIDLEKEVMGDFKPLIPLPAEIVVETGEENEHILFEDRAKLYRFVDQEWKERGTGTVKILHHEGSGRVRLLMRRDQVLKVCANHYISSNMELNALKNSDKAWTWVAPDFADEEIRPEHFCIRFKTPEIAATFKTAFDKAVSISKETDAKTLSSPKITSTISTTSPMLHKPFGGKFLPKAGSWICPTCYVSNAADKLLCVACETKKPGSQAPAVSSPGTLNSEFKTSFQTASTISNNFTFGSPATSTVAQFSTVVTSASTEKSVFGGFTFSSKPLIQEAETPEIKDREILVVSTKSKNGPQVTKVSTSKTSPFSGFSFKAPTLSASTTSSVSVSNNNSITTANISISNIQSSMPNVKPTFVFSQSTPSAKNSATSNESASSGNENNKSGSLFIHVSSEGRRVSRDGNECAPEDFVPTVEFKPVISLPALVDIKTGEEEEVVVFAERAKLFRFDSETKEWKERGTGELKILHMIDSKKYRILMRRDQVLKICANHYILPDMKLTPLSESDRAWIWIAQDYSDGEMSQVKLAAKFKNSDIAQQFYKTFEKCQKELSASNDSDTKPNPCSGNKNTFDQLLQPSSNSWICSKCEKANMNQSSCVYCQTPHSSSIVSVIADNRSLSELFKPASGTWECKACYVRNDPSTNVCACCSSPKPGSDISTATKDTSADTKSVPSGNAAAVSESKSLQPISDLFKPQSGSWECASCLVRNDAELIKCVSCESLKPGTSAPPSSGFSNFTFGTSTSSDAPKFGFGNPKSSEFVFGMKTAPQPPTFTFGLSGLSNKPGETVGFKPTFSTTNNAPSIFGGATQKLESSAAFGGSPQTENSSTSIFGGSQKSGLSQSVSSVFGITQQSASSLNTMFGGGVAKSDSISITPVFGSLTQKAELTSPSCFGSLAPKSESSVSITPVFGSLPSKSESSASTASLFGIISNSESSVTATSTFGNVALKSDSSTIVTPTFGSLTPKSDSSVIITPTFGNLAPKSESSVTVTSAFGSLAPKSEPSVITTPAFGSLAAKYDSSVIVTPAFGNLAPNSDSSVIVTPNFGNLDPKSDSSITFGNLSVKSESLQVTTSLSGTLQKSETSQTSSTSVASTPQTIFSFGSASQGKDDSAPVEFRFGSPQKYEFNFSGVRPRSPTKTPKSPRSPATPSDVEDDEENESFDADNIYFQPVIPLPPKVDLKTGEENEKTIFCKRAKLFRFCSGEWKERGIGEIKILHDDDAKKTRLLMRRDQVLKVCLNHYLTKDIVFEQRGDKTLQWAVTDFSENEPSPELFAVRFKTSEFADEFKTALDNALKLVEKQDTPVDISKAASSFSFKSDSPKLESSFTAGSLSSRFGTSSSEVPIFGGTSSVSENISSPFSFPLKDKSTSSAFFKQPNSSSNLKASDDGVKSVADEKGISNDDDEIQMIYEAVASPEEIKLAKELMLPPTFFLYKKKSSPCPGCIGCDDYIPPPKTSCTSEDIATSNTSTTTAQDEIDSAPMESNLFPKSTVSTISFADLASNTSVTGLNTSSTKKSVFEGAGTPLFANLNTSADAEGDEDTVAEGPDIHFEPVIPLPELIAVKTGEEDETPVFVNRAKLFRFDPDKKEWKERGVGDLKILKHNEKLRFRIILRRDQVHKIACNHCISENMELSPLATSDSALCWNALDYSESQPEASQFAVRFKNKDLLEQFRQRFNECKELLKSAVDQSPEVHSTSINVQDNVKDSQADEISKSPAENSKENLTDHESSELESNDDSDNDSVEFEKRVSFEISDGNDNEFQSVGMGILKVTYDDTVFGYHVYMFSDDDTCVCDHIIAIQTVLMLDNKKATWAAIDLSVDPPRRRRFRATFSSASAATEFNAIFEDGKDAAVSSEIIEKTDYFFSPSGQQT